MGRDTINVRDTTWVPNFAHVPVRDAGVLTRLMYWFGLDASDPTRETTATTIEEELDNAYDEDTYAEPNAVFVQVIQQLALGDDGDAIPTKVPSYQLDVTPTMRIIVENARISWSTALFLAPNEHLCAETAVGTATDGRRYEVVRLTHENDGETDVLYFMRTLGVVNPSEGTSSLYAEYAGWPFPERGFSIESLEVAICDPDVARL